ncbi:hypothetical protein N0V83_000942 [Neocucurbitaria cava]|uniref:Uncharacterized protein n=1 Tax=Neocucurbitaria cava TaxID=798079 RepID=A0A9W9CRK0_9PLEO|nr:hypothetical protein N0V83_000942 [Neocucurbitaria cava]
MTPTVTAASTSFASAMSQSGLGKAGWSIGAALASSARNGARKGALWGLQKSGKEVEELPVPVRKWLGGERRRGRGDDGEQLGG